MDKKKVVAPLVCHGHSRPVVDLFYSPITPDGFFLVSASKDSSPLLRNGETGDWIGTFMGHKGAVWSCCLDKHALRVATASADFSALWDVRTGTIVRTLETKSSVTSAESYDMPCIVESASLEPKFGNKFIAGGEDMWVHLFDFHTGAEIGCNKGHHGPVHCVRFSPGGESYASGSEDGTIRIWQTSPVDQSEPESSAANGPSQGVKAVVNEVTQQMENALIVDDKTTFDETTTIAN
ncbi:Transducin/WD40 repeat-like superfamily protein [Perilla frutescens var. frutescens]|nr:Transducin/WD40 repeat-like superfamily protein [Perilla frutescens var. frutescens]